MKRFSIWVREIDSDHDVELIQLDGDYEPIYRACYAKVLTMQKGSGARGKTKVGKYSYVRVVDNQTGRTIRG